MSSLSRMLGHLTVETAGSSASLKKLRQTVRSPLYANSLYLIVNSVGNAGFGLLFWLVAARLYTTDEVGLGSALVSAGTLIALIASLGLGYGLVRFLPTMGDRRAQLINSSLTIMTASSVVVSAVFLAGVPLWSPAFREFLHPAYVLAFVGFVLLWGFYSLAAVIFVSFRRAAFTLAASMIYNLLRVIGVVALALAFGTFGIIGAWGIAAAIAVAASYLWFLPRLLPGYRPAPTVQRHLIGEVTHFSFVNYLSNGFWQAPQRILPVMVVNVLGATANAHFFVAWGVAALLFAIPTASSMALFAEGSHSVERLGRDLRRSLKFTALLLIPAVTLMLTLGSRILLLFGQEYSEGGTGVIWFLAPSAIPVSVNFLYLGAARVLKRLRDIVLVTGGIAVGTLALGYLLLPVLGANGPAVAWLAAQGVVALAVLPRLIAIIRGREMVG